MSKHRARPSSMLPPSVPDGRGDAVVTSSRPLDGCHKEQSQREKTKEQEMKKSQFMGAATAGHSLRVLATSAMLFAVLAVTTAVISPSGALAAQSGRHGGAGQVFDWNLAAAAGRRIILAGGLDASNVGCAIELARPWGVDACSRIEAAPGKKDHKKMTEFLQAARAALGA